MIEIRERKRASVFQKVEPYHARNVGERSIAVVGIENISFVPAPRAIRPDQFVNRAPALFVVVRRLGFVRRIGNHLPPEKAVQVFVLVFGHFFFGQGTANHAVCDVKIGETVVIKIPGIARPRPAPDPDPGNAGCIFESENAAAVSRKLILKKRIAHGVFVIERSRFRGRVLLEDILRRNAFARRRPHVGYIEVLRAVTVIVKAADAHARADVLHSHLRSNVGKSSIAVVAVKIFSSEIIDHVKVGPTVAVEVTPSATKAVTRVVLVEASFGSYVTKRSVALVAHHEIWRAVLGGIIRGRIFVLVRPLVIDVEAEVDIGPTVAVVISHGRTRECALWRSGELKRIRFLAKLAATLVEK